jgi:hypothetical protein
VVIALSDIAVAMIVGGATLAGAAIGGVIGGVLTLRADEGRAAREEVRERNEARAAARLVWLDLDYARSAFDSSFQKKEWTVGNPPTDAWREHRGVLASFLDLSEWRDVADAVGAVEWERNKADVGKSVDDPTGLQKSLDKVRRAVERLYPFVEPRPIEGTVQPSLFGLVRTTLSPSKRGRPTRSSTG